LDDKTLPFRYVKTSPEIIRLALMLCIRFPLTLRNVEDLLHDRDIQVNSPRLSASAVAHSTGRSGFVAQMP
jgi:transposase-like protein